MSLSDRIRPNTEAAPWVIKEVNKLERELTALLAERDQLRSDCENETKWAAHYLAESIAVKAERDQLRAELATEREKVRLLKFDKDRLDWYNGESYYQFGKSHKCMDSGWWWSCGYQQNNGKSGIQNIRDTIDSAMAHSKSGRNKYNVCKRIEDSIKEDAK